MSITRWVCTVYTCVQYKILIKATLLEAIKDEEVFGFIKCDINSPDEMIKRHLRTGFLFPPVISKQVIEDDMLSPYMKEVIAKRKKQPKVYPILIHQLNNISVWSWASPNIPCQTNIPHDSIGEILFGSGIENHKCHWSHPVLARKRSVAVCQTSGPATVRGNWWRWPCQTAYGKAFWKCRLVYTSRGSRTHVYKIT